ncbi:MAG: DUF1611 domain-containing protein [Chthonomonadales bacterium]
MSNPRITPSNRLALLMHDHVTSPNGKMGFGLMRYGVAPIAVVIDRSKAGQNLRELTGIPCDAPIVSSIQESLKYNPDVLVPAIAPGGGMLPDGWMHDITFALENGMSIVNGLHRPLADLPEFASRLQEGRFIWDVRQEPPGLQNGLGRARELACRRVLFVGTDMACGKMTAALEMHAEAQKAGFKSKFAATGQIGISIAGEGIPLDAVRIDFATGAVESLVMRLGEDADVVFIEGQGSLLNPASTATLALMRGGCPTDMILVHRYGQKVINRADWANIPPLKEVMQLNEDVCRAGGALPVAKVRGIALVTSHLSESGANAAMAEVEAETGLPTVDVVRHGANKLLASLNL